MAPRYKKTGPGRPKTRSKTHVTVSKNIYSDKKQVTLKSRGASRNTGKPRGWNLKRGELDGDTGRRYTAYHRQDKRREVVHDEWIKSLEKDGLRSFDKEWKSGAITSVFPKRKSHQKKK